jgi:hypothetical protein
MDATATLVLFTLIRIILPLILVLFVGSLIERLYSPKAH